jgi:hypothetical protein
MPHRDDDLLHELPSRLGNWSSRTARPYDDLLFTVQELARQDQFDANALRELADKIGRYLGSIYDPDISWDQAEYHDIRDLSDPVLEWKQVKIRALLERMTVPLAVTLAGEKHLTTIMTFRDVDTSDRIESLHTVNTDLIRRLKAEKDDHHTFDILGTVVLVPIATGAGESFHLLVHDVRPAEAPLQMLRAKQVEIEEARSTLLEIRRNQQSVYEYVQAMLVKELGISGLDRAQELKDSLEAIIVQAFSDGWVHNCSGKLHTLIIGAPAVGKKLLTEAAQCLNPAFEEAHPSKATVAGVCSTATQKEGVWVSKPGYLPLAHRGVFAIQDFHAVKDAQREKLLGIFNMVMEDGRVIDSTAARQTYPALTSIHLDTNKRTDLFPDSQLRGDTIVARRLDDIRIPMTILSRFDFIIDIPRDPKRQLEVSLAMYQRPSMVHGTMSPVQRRSEWSRRLQVLVALLRTEHADIDFPEPILRHMQRQQERLWQESMDQLRTIPWLSDFQSRLTNSVFKIVAAYARMNDRDAPVAQDVDAAFRLIFRKYAFVATLAQCLTLPTTLEVPEGPDLEQWLREQFAGQQRSTAEVLTAYREFFRVDPVRRTIERHLPRVARRVRKGTWEFPGERLGTPQQEGR